MTNRLNDKKTDTTEKDMSVCLFILSVCFFLRWRLTLNVRVSLANMLVFVKQSDFRCLFVFNHERVCV